jgi:hypothetical protein
MNKACSTNGEEKKKKKKKKKNEYGILVGKPEGNRPLGKPRRRWENNIKMDIKGIELNSMDWNPLKTEFLLNNI